MRRALFGHPRPFQTDDVGLIAHLVLRPDRFDQGTGGETVMDAIVSGLEKEWPKLGRRRRTDTQSLYDEVVIELTDRPVDQKTTRLLSAVGPVQEKEVEQTPSFRVAIYSGRFTPEELWEVSKFLESGRGDVFGSKNQSVVGRIGAPLSGEE